MGQANPAPAPSMEEILASIRRIISDEHTENAANEAVSADKTAEMAADVVDAVTAPPTEDIAQEPAAQAMSLEDSSDQATDPQTNSAVTDEADLDAAMMASQQDDVAELPSFDEVSEPEAEFEPMEPMELPADDLVEEDAAEQTPVETVAEPDIEAPLMLTDVMELSEEATPFVPEEADNLPAPGLLSAETDASVASNFKNLQDMLAKESQTLEGMTNELLKPMLKEWLDDNLPQLVERLVREEIQRVARG